MRRRAGSLQEGLWSRDRWPISVSWLNPKYRQAVNSYQLSVTELALCFLRCWIQLGVRRFGTDVSGLPIRPIFNGRDIQDIWNWSFGTTYRVPSWRVKMNKVVPKHRFQTTSRRVTTPEDGRIQFNRGASLQCRMSMTSWNVKMGPLGNSRNVGLKPPYAA